MSAFLADADRSRAESQSKITPTSTGWCGQWQDRSIAVGFRRSGQCCQILAGTLGGDPTRAAATGWITTKGMNLVVFLARHDGDSEVIVVDHHPSRKDNILMVYTLFEPNRLERSSLQIA